MERRMCVSGINLYYYLSCGASVVMNIKHLK